MSRRKQAKSVQPTPTFRLLVPWQKPSPSTELLARDVFDSPESKIQLLWPFQQEALVCDESMLPHKQTLFREIIKTRTLVKSILVNSESYCEHLVG